MLTMNPNETRDQRI